MSLTDIWWDSVKSEMLIDREAFNKLAAEWTIHPIYVEDELAALFLEKNNEVHFIKLGKHQITRADEFDYHYRLEKIRHA